MKSACALSSSDINSLFKICVTFNVGKNSLAAFCASSKIDRKVNLKLVQIGIKGSWFAESPQCKTASLACSLRQLPRLTIFKKIDRRHFETQVLRD